MPSDEYLINELARQAGVTPRTIRYYTNEGLLPQPMAKGKYAYYTQEHLNRLRLILRMKDTYLPLREIRQAINALTDQEVAIHLQDPLPPAEVDSISDQPSSGAGARALDYIARIRENQAGVRSTYQAKLAPAAPPAPAAMTPTAPRPLAQPETWQRIPLAPGVELHLREPASIQTADAIQHLLVYARQLFYNRTKES